MEEGNKKFYETLNIYMNGTIEEKFWLENIYYSLKEILLVSNIDNIYESLLLWIEDNDIELMDFDSFLDDLENLSINNTNDLQVRPSYSVKLDNLEFSILMSIIDLYDFRLDKDN